MSEQHDIDPPPRREDYPELFPGTERVVEVPRSRWPQIALVVTLISVIAGSVAWYAIKGMEITVDGNAPVPMVQADPAPIKIRPEEPGGMQVPNRDKLIYDRFGGEVTRPGVERLLPPPEAPLPPPSAPPSTPRELSVSAKPPAPPPLVPGPITTLPGGGDAAESFRVPPPVSLPLPAPPPMPPVINAPVATSTAVGSFRVQLGAVRDEPAAKSEWTRLKQRHSDVLGNLELDVERADLGERGIFFRVRGGPLAEEAAAKRICETLKTRNVGCLVVR